MLDCINFESFSICTLSVILDTTIKTVIIETTGTIRFLIKLPINSIKNNNNGSTTVVVAIFPCKHHKSNKKWNQNS